jgi:hypothetical protein
MIDWHRDSLNKAENQSYLTYRVHDYVWVIRIITEGWEQQTHQPGSLGHFVGRRHKRAADGTWKQMIWKANILGIRVQDLQDSHILK